MLENKTINEEVEKAKHSVCSTIDQNTVFQEEVRTLMLNNEFEALLCFLKEKKQFIDEQFIMGTLSQALGAYFMAMANVILCQKFPFLEERQDLRREDERFYYIGKYDYKAHTRKIVRLHLIRQVQQMGIEVEICSAILEEWKDLAQVQANLEKEQTTRQKAYAATQAAFDQAVQVEQEKVERTLSEYRKRYHSLTSKVIKKQSEIQKVDQEIKALSQRLQQLDEAAETCFPEEAKKLAQATQQLKEAEEKLASISFMKAFVRQEEACLAEAGWNFVSFPTQITNLSKEWQALPSKKVKQ